MFISFVPPYTRVAPTINQNQTVAQNENNVGATLVVAQNQTIDQNTTIAQNQTITQNTTVPKNQTIDQNTTVPQNQTITQNTTVSKNNDGQTRYRATTRVAPTINQNQTVAQNENNVGATLVVAQNQTIDQNTTVAQNQTIDQNTTVSQNQTVNQNTTVAQNQTIDAEKSIDVGETINTGKTVGEMVGAFQSIVTVKYIDGVKTLGWHPFDKKLWQRNYWEHIIRNENEFNRIAEYIINNPQKWDNDNLKS